MSFHSDDRFPSPTRRYFSPIGPGSPPPPRCQLKTRSIALSIGVQPPPFFLGDLSPTPHRQGKLARIIFPVFSFPSPGSPSPSYLFSSKAPVLALTPLAPKVSSLFPPDLRPIDMLLPTFSSPSKLQLIVFRSHGAFLQTPVGQDQVFVAPSPNSQFASRHLSALLPFLSGFSPQCLLITPRNTQLSLASYRAFFFPLLAHSAWFFCPPPFPDSPSFCVASFC